VTVAKRSADRVLRAWRLVRGAPLALLLVLLAIGIANALWIAHNAYYIQDEVASHLDGAADFRNRAWGVLAHERNPVLVVADLLDLMNSRSGGSLAWPRATYAVSALVSPLVGDAERWPFYSNFAFLLLSLAGFALAMHRLYPSSARSAVEAALLAGVLWSLFPGTYGPLRLYGLDFPLACCLMPGLALLMATDGFSHRRNSVLFGVFCAFALSVKGQFVVYLAPALVVAAAFALRDGATDLRSRVFHIGLAAIAPLVAIVVWLHGSIGEVARLFYIMVLPHAVDPTVDAIRAPPKPFEWFSLAWLTYWVRASIANLGVMGTLALAASPALLAMRRREQPLGRDGWLIVTTAIGLLVIWTAMPARDMRFVFPFLPVYAAVAAMALMRLKPLPRGLSVALLIVLGTALAGRLSLDPVHHATAAERIHRTLGWDAGHIMARPVSTDPFPGLAYAIDHQLGTICPGRPGRVALAAVPYADGRSLFDHYNEQVRTESFRLKCRRRSVAWRDSPFLHPRTYRHLGSADTLDPRYIPPTYFEREALELDLLVVFHFFSEYEYVEPSYRSWAFPGAIPDLFTARDVEEMEARLPPGFQRSEVRRFGGSKLPPAHVYFYVNAGR